MQDLEINQFIVRKVQDIESSKRLARLLLSLGLSSSDSSVKETWIIECKSEKTDLGYINIATMDDGLREIGFVLLPQFRAKGVLSCVLPAFVKAFGWSLYTETAEDNHAAIRVLLKSGFSKCTPLHPEHSDPYGRVHKTVALSFEV